MAVRITGKCAHCGKITIMGKEANWQVRWDFWTEETDEGDMRGSSATTLCNDCCIKLQYGFLTNNK